MSADWEDLPVIKTTTVDLHELLESFVFQVVTADFPSMYAW